MSIAQRLRIIPTLISLLSVAWCNAVSPFTVMLAPMGDARTTGRIIDKNFERWIAWEYAREVKSRLEREIKGINVVFSRASGEIVQPLECANFANRLRVDVLVSINFFAETEALPRCFFYQFSYGDEFVTLSDELAFHTYDRAHIIKRGQATRMIERMRDLFASDSYCRQFKTSLHRMPFSPLIGMVCPAMGVEMGIKTVNGANAYVEPLVEGIKVLKREWGSVV